MDDLTIKLLSKVNVDGMEYDKLTLRELTVDEVIELEDKHGTKVPTAQDKYFFAMACNVPPEVIGSLGQRDFIRLRNLHTDKLGNVKPEGENSE